MYSHKNDRHNLVSSVVILSDGWDVKPNFGLMTHMKLLIQS